MRNWTGQTTDYRLLLLIKSSGFVFIRLGNLINFDDMLVCLMYKHNSLKTIFYMYLLVWKTNKYNSLETLAYMAPEQFEGKADPARERYAIASKSYKRLTGRLLLSSTRHDTYITWGQMHKEPLLLTRFNTLTLKAVERTIVNALTKDPTNRYPNVSMLAIALQIAVERCQEVKAQ